MKFVRTDNLKIGMRLAKPIYNRNGVMLYERNTELTAQGINSIANFQLLGIYILEPAEPVPPMSNEDVEFERFQTMAIFNLKDDLKNVFDKTDSKELYKLANLILQAFGKKDHKVNFIQNLRSPQDYVYKHTLNTAILCALIAGAMKIQLRNELDLVMAALLHDAGKLLLTGDLAKKSEGYTPEELVQVEHARDEVYNMLLLDYDLGSNVRIIMSQWMNKQRKGKYDKTPMAEARILEVASLYDEMTAMKINQEPMSDIATLKFFYEHEEEFGHDVVAGLLDSLAILVPGVCVELSNKEKGLILAENTKDVFRPMVLEFKRNIIYDLSNTETYDIVQITDVMKTMDNRAVTNEGLLQSYRERASKIMN